MDDKREEGGGKRHKTETTEKSTSEPMETTLDLEREFQKAIQEKNIARIKLLLPNVDISPQTLDFALGKPDIIQLLLSEPDQSEREFLTKLAYVRPDLLEAMINKLITKYNVNNELLKSLIFPAIKVLFLNNHLDKVEPLLKLLNTDIVNAKDQNGNTLLHMFCNKKKFDENDLKIVEKLIELGVNVNAQNKNGDTPLHLALSSDKMVELLVSKGNANHAIKNNEGDTSLHVALKENLALSKYLIDKNTINLLDKDSNAAIILAIQRQQLENVNSLLNNPDLDLNVVNEKGDTPLLYAAKSGNIELFRSVINKDKNEAATNYNGFNVLHCIILGDYKEKITAFTDLINKFKNTTDSMGKNPCCLINNIDFLRKYIEIAGKDVILQKDMFSLTTIDWLSLQINKEDLNLFLKELNINVLPKTLKQMRKSIKEVVLKNEKTFCLSTIHDGKNPLLEKLTSSIFFINPNHKKYLGNKIMSDLEKLCNSTNNILAKFLQAQDNIFNNKYDEQYRYLIQHELFYQAYSSLRDLSKIVKDQSELRKLLEVPKIINVRDSDLNNMLHLAVKEQNILLIATLVEEEININGLDKNHKTPLDYCDENSPMYKYLIDHGAKKGDEIKKARQHLTFTNSDGKTLANFPVRTAKEEAMGLFDHHTNVFVAIESTHFLSTMVHEWAHRFVQLFNVDLQTPLLKFFKNTAPDSNYNINATSIVQEDCKRILLDARKYPAEKQLEEFFVRIMEIIAKHGDQAMKFLKKNFGKELLEAIEKIVEHPKLSVELSTSPSGPSHTPSPAPAPSVTTSPATVPTHTPSQPHMSDHGSSTFFHHAHNPSQGEKTEQDKTKQIDQDDLTDPNKSQKPT